MPWADREQRGENSKESSGASVRGSVAGALVRDIRSYKDE